LVIFIKDSSKCPHCDNEIPPRAPGGLCPTCLFGRAIDLEEKPELTARPTVLAEEKKEPGEKADDRIGRYTLLGLIGEGGMGTVWLAEQQEPVVRKGLRGGDRRGHAPDRDRARGGNARLHEPRTGER